VHPPLEIAQRFDQDLSFSAPVSPLPNLFGSNEASLDQPMSQKTGEPFAVGDVRLATGYMFGVARIDENHLYSVFENIENGAPVHAGAFHSHNRTLVLEQPFLEGSQIMGKGTEFAEINPFASSRSCDQTTGDLLFVYVQTAANRVQYLYDSDIFLLGHGNLLFDFMVYL